jgi:hypothetical protein
VVESGTGYIFYVTGAVSIVVALDRFVLSEKQTWRNDDDLQDG